MEEKLISVIVPVYNVEKYLKRCVDSILNQTYKKLEIILVDDGSTDSSGKLCDEYLDIDKRVTVFHKENGGLSDARNFGIDRAEGEFISFIDSDDYIESKMLEVLYNLIIHNNSDISICGTSDCYENGKRTSCSNNIIGVCAGKEAVEIALEGKLYGMSVCTKLINSKLLTKHRFEKGKTSEDVFFTPPLLFKANKVSYTTEPLYNYWHRASSITTSPFNSRGMDVVEGYIRNLDFINKNCPELLPVAQFRLYWAYFIALDRMIVTPNYKSLSCYKKVKLYLKKNWFKILTCKYFNKTRRCATIILKINIDLYKRIVILYNKKIAEVYN